MPLVIKLFDNDVDVTDWQYKHPGGTKLLKIFENRDATQQFSAIHKGDRAIKMFNQLPKVKSPQASSTQNPVELEFKELIEKLKPELTTVYTWYEVLKLTYILSFVSGGYYLCFHDHKYVGLSMMCLAIYQAGWVGHDYSHRSILASSTANNRISDFLGFIQGYSDIWWKLRHNTHHMTTNELGNDPDIRTEPVFHFFDKANRELADKQSAVTSKHNTKKRLSVSKHIPNQQILFTFLLGTLDLFWRYESITVLSKSPKKYAMQIVMLVLHYCLMAWLLVFSPVTILDILLFSLAKGFMTAIVVFANHYPEDRLPPDHKMGLFEQTLRTSRNTTGLFIHHPGDGFLRRLFNESTGFLSMQIEHHLVPTWPSGNLMSLRPYVQALAKKYNLPYHETSILEASVDNICKLSDCSLEALKKIQ